MRKGYHNLRLFEQPEYTEGNACPIESKRSFRIFRLKVPSAYLYGYGLLLHPTTLLYYLHEYRIRYGFYLSDTRLWGWDRP
jgi:hypothetical protein